MTGDGANDAPSLKQADTGIAVEGASNAARSAVDIVLLAPSLAAIVEVLKLSRQIFHRMRAYVMYRIALSIHLLIYIVVDQIAFDETLDSHAAVVIAAFADVATLVIAYDNAPCSQVPCRWNLRKMWMMATVLGIALAISTCVLRNVIPRLGAGGISDVELVKTSILLLQIGLCQSWTILLTRGLGNWKMRPSWQLIGAIIMIDVFATLVSVFNWFPFDSEGTLHYIIVIEVWVYSALVSALLVCVAWTLDTQNIRSCIPGRWRKKARNS